MPDRSEPIRVAAVPIERYNMLALTALLEPLRVANFLTGRELYAWEYRAVRPGPVVASNGMAVECGKLHNDDDRRGRFDLIAVCASWNAEHVDEPLLSAWLRRHARTGARLIGVESGVHALARAGLLDGRRATIHWSWKPGFAEQYPAVEVCEQAFTIDGPVMTCAGGPFGIDLMLQLIAGDHGEALAREVGDQLLHLGRPAQSAQRFFTARFDDGPHPLVRQAIAVIESEIEDPPDIPRLCRRLGVSQRHLERLFRRHVGCTVVGFSRLARLQYARVLLTATKLSIREVATASGFASMSYFARCFAAVFAKQPSAYRLAWPDDEPAPQWPGTLYSQISSQQSFGDRRPHPRQRPA